jgi:hypothetical protein
LLHALIELLPRTRLLAVGCRRLTGLLAVATRLLRGLASHRGLASGRLTEATAGGLTTGGLASGRLTVSTGLLTHRRLASGRRCATGRLAHASGRRSTAGRLLAKTSGLASGRGTSHTGRRRSGLRRCGGLRRCDRLLRTGNRCGGRILKSRSTTTGGRWRSGAGTGKHGAALLHGAGEVDVLNRDHRLAESHRVADAEVDRTGDSLTTGKERSVRRAEVLKDQLTGLESDLGVSTGDLRIQQSDVTDVSADDDRLLIERLGFGGAARVLNVQGVERHRGS